MYQIYTINSCNNHTKKTSFMSFHTNFLKTNVYFYYSDSSINISINSCNYHKRTSFKSFHPNFLKTNVYHYSLTLIYQIHTINSTNTAKKLVSSFFALITWKSISITVIQYLETYLTNAYHKFMQLRQKTNFKSFHANYFKINVYYYYIVSKYSKFTQLPQKS